MSIERTFLRLLKSRKKKINNHENNVIKFKKYIEKEWLFLEEYNLKLEYNSFNDAVFYTKDNRFHFVITYNDPFKYRRTDSNDFYSNLFTNSKKEFIKDMLDLIDV